MASPSGETDANGPGGFLAPTGSASTANGLLSPAASTAASSSAASSVLPKPRSQPLRSGSAKESTFINYMDREIMGVTRRYAKKFDRVEENAAVATGIATPRDDSGSHGGGNSLRHEQGYSSFTAVAKDIDRLVSVLWVSGTPALQIQYLLTLALLVVTYMPAFAPAPRAMFRTLERLDYAFASLVTGRDAETDEELPGFGFGVRSGLTATEKVRVKSLVERTRVVVVELMASGEEIDEEDEDWDEDEAGTGDERDREIDVDDMGGDWGMQVARVYDRTIVELGDTLGKGDVAMAEGE